MHKSLKMLLMMAALVAAALSTAATAQASRGIQTSATTIGASGVLVMNSVITCDVLLSLTLNDNTIEKSNTTTAQGRAGPGYIRNCTGSLAANPPNNTGTIGANIPVFYRSFTGTLPNVDIAVRANPAAFTLNTVVGTCAYGGDLDNVVFDTDGRAIRAVDFNNSAPLPRTSGILCPGTGTIRGTLTVFLPSAPTIALV